MSNSTPVAPAHTHGAPTESNGVGATASAAAPKKRGPAKRSGKTMLVHVNLPTQLVMNIRALADADDRTITSMVKLLLEQSPDYIEWERESQLPKTVQG